MAIAIFFKAIRIVLLFQRDASFLAYKKILKQMPHICLSKRIFPY